jgi:hypothetical protein
MENTFRFNTIAEFHSFCQLPNPEHPLISLVDYSQVKYPDLGVQMKWVQNFYTIGLKRNVSGKFNYGQTQYDFNTGLLSFVAPLQCLKVEINPNVEVEPTGWLLLIHPDFCGIQDWRRKSNLMIFSNMLSMKRYLCQTERKKLWWRFYVKSNMNINLRWINLVKS